MDCLQFEDERLLDAYGELEEESKEYTAHIAICPTCREDLGDIRDLSEQYRQESTERLPALVLPRIRRRRDWWLPAAAAALLAIALVTSVLPKADSTDESVGIELPADRLSLHTPVPNWESEDSAFDAELSHIRNRLDGLERELRRSQ